MRLGPPATSVAVEQVTRLDTEKKSERARRSNKICLKTDVWEHFGFKTKKESDALDKSFTVCKLCHTSVIYSGNTTNLRAHLKRHHPDKAVLTEGPKKLRRDPKQTVLDSDGSCWKEVNDGLIAEAAKLSMQPSGVRLI